MNKVQIELIVVTMLMSTFQLVILTIGLYLISADSCPSKCTCNDQVFFCESITSDELTEKLVSFKPPKKGLILSNFEVNHIVADMFTSIGFIKSLSIVDSPDVLTIDENAFRGLDTIESLVIKDTSINDLPEKLFMPVRKSLKYLELIDNEIAKLPEKIFQGMEGLKTIDLKGNPLKKLPPVTVFSYPSLNRTTVLLKSNNISCSPCTPSIVDMASLINDRNYPIRAECTMPDPLTGTRLIKDLKCDKMITSQTTTNTKLATFESRTTPTLKSTTATTARVNGCPMKCSCNENAIRCDTVTSDELSDILTSIKPSNRNSTFILNNFQANRIASNEFEKIRHIKHLAITDSPGVHSINEDAFQGLDNITSICMNQTSITDLPENLFDPVRATLRFLELTNNKFTTLHKKTFMGMKVLQTIDLTGNPLQLPQATVFDYPGLNRTVVRLKDNNISCSPCSPTIVQMVMLINDKNSPISIVCTTPDNLAGTKLDKLTKDDLNCDDVTSTLNTAAETTAATTETATPTKDLKSTKATTTTNRPTTERETTTSSTTHIETTMPTTKRGTTMPTIQRETTRPTTLLETTKSSTTTASVSSTTAPATTTPLITIPRSERQTTTAKTLTTPNVAKTKPICPKKCSCSGEVIECIGITENDLTQITTQMDKNKTYLLIKNFKTSKIGADLFKGVPDISKIAITESPDVTSIDEDAFSSLKSCKSITIMGTLITDLPGNLFQPVANKLHYIDLTNNKIAMFGSGLFGVIRNLRTLDLSGNLLKNHLTPNETFGYPTLWRTAISLLHNNISCDPCAPSVKELLELIYNRSYTISVECGTPNKFYGSLLETLSRDELKCDGGQVSELTNIFNYGWLIVCGAIILAGLCIFGIVREFRQHKYKLIKDRESDFFSLDDGPDTMADMDDPCDEMPLLEVNSFLRKSFNENTKLV